MLALKCDFKVLHISGTAPSHETVLYLWVFTWVACRCVVFLNPPCLPGSFVKHVTGGTWGNLSLALEALEGMTASYGWIRPLPWGPARYVLDLWRLIKTCQLILYYGDITLMEKYTVRSTYIDTWNVLCKMILTHMSKMWWLHLKLPDTTPFFSIVPVSLFSTQSEKGLIIVYIYNTPFIVKPISGLQKMDIWPKWKQMNKWMPTNNKNVCDWQIVQWQP